MQEGGNSGLDYAKSFYNTEVKFGEYLTISEDNVPQVVLQEIIVNKDSRARGYVVIKVETNEFLLFADVDKSSNVLTVYDNLEYKTVKFDNLRSSENYLSTDKFDFVKYTGQNVVTAKEGCGFWKKLWGTCVSDPWTEGAGIGLCMDYNKITRYFLFQPQPGSIDKNPISVAYPCE